MFITFLLFCYDLFMICVWLFYYMFMTYLYNCYGMFITFVIIFLWYILYPPQQKRKKVQRKVHLSRAEVLCVLCKATGPRGPAKKQWVFNDFTIHRPPEIRSPGSIGWPHRRPPGLRGLVIKLKNSIFTYIKI